MFKQCDGLRLDRIRHILRLAVFFPTAGVFFVALTGMVVQLIVKLHFDAMGSFIGSENIPNGCVRGIYLDKVFGHNDIEFCLIHATIRRYRLFS